MTQLPRSKVGKTPVNRADIINDNFIKYVHELHARVNIERPKDALSVMCFENCSMTGQEFLELFESQIQSRQLDLLARTRLLHTTFTLGSSGHEGNAIVGRLSRFTDPAFLHYRSGAFMAERSRYNPDINFINDTSLALVSSRRDPSTGGRHKAWTSKPLWVLPQTNTIAAHLPKAVGTAVAISHASVLSHTLPIPSDSIVLCSFGDASANHSTAVGAINAAQWATHQGIPVPIVFICEDNGFGKSVRTPPDWIEENFSHRKGLKYFQGNALDLRQSYDTVDKAINYCREHRQPVFLHLKMVRLMGHAVNDIEILYRDIDELQKTEQKDPLLLSAKIAVESGFMSATDILSLYNTTRERCDAAIDKVKKQKKLATAAQIMASLAPFSPDDVIHEAQRDGYMSLRLEVYGDRDSLPENQPPDNLATQINRVLCDSLIKYPQSLVFGEDVARKGGAYSVTTGLSEIFKSNRVFTSLVDEQMILGLAQGYGNMGMLPIPEIQNLAFFYNASDQIRAHAAAIQFFSNGQFSNPMVIRIASFAYQTGADNQFHNDNSIAALRDIPGIVIACPSRADDAALIFRSLIALAQINGRVCFFLEPSALYKTRDLYQDGDNEWLFQYPEISKAITIGEGRIYNPVASDLLIISYANGVPLSLRAVKEVQQHCDKKLRVLDLRWLQPLNNKQIIENALQCKAVLIVDEGRETGSVGESIVTLLTLELQQKIPINLIASEDSYLPIGVSADSVLPSTAKIVEAINALI